MSTALEYWWIVIPLKIWLWSWIWKKARSGPRYTTLDEMKQRNKFGQVTPETQAAEDAFQARMKARRKAEHAYGVALIRQQRQQQAEQARQQRDQVGRGDG